MTLTAPDGATLDGSTLDGPTAGISIPGRSGAAPTVRNITITGYRWGVFAGFRSAGDWTVVDTAVRNQTSHGIRAQDVGQGTAGNWTIRGSTVADNGGWGVLARGTVGAWSIHRSTITGNAEGGIDATDAAIEGTATDNRWGQPGGPTAHQCVGNVDCGAGEPGPGLVATYDDDGDGTIDIRELGRASADYALGEIGISELGEIASVFVQS